MMSLGRKSREKTAFPKSDEPRAAEAAKIARLRALRLAKEADDRVAEQSAAAERAKLKRAPRVRSAVRAASNAADKAAAS